MPEEPYFFIFVIFVPKLRDELFRLNEREEKKWVK